MSYISYMGVNIRHFLCIYKCSLFCAYAITLCIYECGTTAADVSSGDADSSVHIFKSEQLKFARLGQLIQKRITQSDNNCREKHIHRIRKSKYPE